MIPIGDETGQKPGGFPVVTVVLIVVNVLVFLLQITQGGEGFERVVRAYGAIPAEITGGQDIGVPGPTPIYLTLLTSMFMHANWMHLGGNMLFLWVFGDNLEHRMGPLRFLVFYLVCGLLASAAHILFAMGSETPTIGASGAIAGVMGGYLLLFPQARVRMLGRFGVFAVPAWMMLGFWILTQVLAGWQQWGGRELSGVAYAAHVGGFIAGLVLVKLFAAGEPGRRVAEA